MGNKLARNRLKAQDFHYIAKNTAFLTNDVSNSAVSRLCARIVAIPFQVVLDYYNGVMEKSGSTGQMDCETFKSIFRSYLKHVSLSL